MYLQVGFSTCTNIHDIYYSHTVVSHTVKYTGVQNQTATGRHTDIHRLCILCVFPVSMSFFIPPPPLSLSLLNVLDQRLFLFLCSCLWDPRESRSKQTRPVCDRCRSHMGARRPAHYFIFMISSCSSRSRALGEEALSHAPLSGG